MDIMLVGGLSPMTKRLCSKLHKEGHKIFVLSGGQSPSIHYDHVFERYDFAYSNASVGEVFRSVNPDVTILMGAFDGNLPGKDSRQEAVQYAAGLQNILLSWAALGKGRLVFLSSAEVFGDSYQIPILEEMRPVPGGTRSLMLFQAEESCRTYRDQLQKDVVVLRLDRLYDVPNNRGEATAGICQKKCLDAMQNGAVTYRGHYQYGLTYMGDAVEVIYKVVAAAQLRHGLYHIASGRPFSEWQIVQAIESCVGGRLEKIDDSIEEERYSVFLGNNRIREEFGFEVRCEPEEIIRRTIQFIQRHSARFLDENHPGLSPWRRFYNRTMRLMGALVPYLENLVLFIPFFMLNNRATDSQYFSKIDFYLLYVLLFATVYGQRQATFSALLATGGYLFRQMYFQSGISVVTDYNTYVWIAEIFILGLVVGYMRDQLRFIKEENEQEVDFLSGCLTDIADINDSNLRVKNGLINQVVNYDYSLGTIYNLVEQLEAENPAKILFHAIVLVQNAMSCRDVSLYRINEEGYAKLFGYTSAKAAAMGQTVYLPKQGEFYEVLARSEVFLNRTMDEKLPVMAYCVGDEDRMETMILLWSIPFERMTIDEANRLTIISKLIQRSVNRSASYLELLRSRRYREDSPALMPEAFEEVVETYREAGEKNLTEYILLRVLSADGGLTQAGITIAESMRSNDYVGYRADGSLCILLACTDRTGCGFVQRKLEQKGIYTEIAEEVGL